MPIIFDLSTGEAAIQFLSCFINRKEEEILNFIKLDHTDYNTKTFIEQLGINLYDLELQDIEAIMLHVTTNNDQNNSIEKYGLLNLQQSLTMDTPLKNYLKEKGITFDVVNRIMLIGSQNIDITRKEEYLSRDSKEEKINNVSYKIYEDYQINGFLCSPNPLSYGGGVSRRPEILHNISKLFKESPLERDWEEKVESYIIKFRIPLDELIWFSFYKSKDYYIEDIFEQKHIKYSLIDKALRVIWKCHYNRPLPEIYAFLKPEVIVPYKNIISIT